MIKLQTTNHSKFSIMKLVVKCDDIVLFTSLSLLPFFIFIDYYDEIWLFKKHVDQKPLTKFGEDS